MRIESTIKVCLDDGEREELYRTVNKLIMNNKTSLENLGLTKHEIDLLCELVGTLEGEL